MGSTGLNVLIVLFFVGLVVAAGYFFLMPGTVTFTATSPAISSVPVISFPEEDNVSHLRPAVTLPDDDLPEVIFHPDNATVMTLSLADLRDTGRLTDEEDGAFRRATDGWYDLPEEERRAALERIRPIIARLLRQYATKLKRSTTPPPVGTGTEGTDE